MFDTPEPFVWRLDYGGWGSDDPCGPCDEKFGFLVTQYSAEIVGIPSLGSSEDTQYSAEVVECGLQGVRQFGCAGSIDFLTVPDHLFGATWFSFPIGSTVVHFGVCMYDPTR